MNDERTNDGDGPPDIPQNDLTTADGIESQFSDGLGEHMVHDVQFRLQLAQLRATELLNSRVAIVITQLTGIDKRFKDVTAAL